MTPEEKRAYNKTYYQANRERLLPEAKLRRKAYYIAHREQEKARNLAYAKSHPKEIARWQKQWAIMNADRRRVYSRRHRALREAWKKAHPERMAAYRKAWNKKNPNWVRDYQRRKRREYLQPLLGGVNVSPSLPD